VTKVSSANAHASTLNTLLARGKTKRATRTSTSSNLGKILGIGKFVGVPGMQTQGLGEG